MVRRCSAVRVACVALIAANSAWYAGAVTGAGTNTGNCSGPLRTNMLQLPARLSSLAGLNGGKFSTEVTALSQLRPHIDEISTNELTALRCLVGFVISFVSLHAAFICQRNPVGSRSSDVTSVYYSTDTHAANHISRP